MMSYKRFAAMIVVATLAMFGLMYLNTYVFGHVLFSQTRMWMALLMGAVMAVLMIAFMWEMYPDRRIKIGIVIGSLMVATASLWLVRSQETVSDVAYMKAMIPHHSIAIMTSERAHIKDTQVRRLADGIIDAQIREIAEMKQMIARLDTSVLLAFAQGERHDVDEDTLLSRAAVSAISVAEFAPSCSTRACRPTRSKRPCAISI